MSPPLTRPDKLRLGYSTGCPPVGYRNVCRPGGSFAVWDAERAPLVQKVFSYALRYGLPLPRLADYAARIGLTSRTGGPVGTSALWAILTNPFYAGYVRAGGTLVRGRHVPLVDEGDFLRVRAQLSGRRKGASVAVSESGPTSFSG